MDYQLGADAAIVLQYGTTDQSVVSGLNSLGLPEMMRTKIKVEEFRKDFSISFTGGGEYGALTFGGNMVFGDTLGQDKLKSYFKANTKFTTARVYMDLENFLAPDLANDSASGFQVASYKPGKVDRNKVIPFDGELVLNGDVAYFTSHIANSAGITFSTADNSINDSASGFLTAGFKAGQTIIIEGSTSTNNGQCIADSVVAGKIIVTAASKTIVTETGAKISLHGGQI